MTEYQERFARCAHLIAQTDGILITAGAGMGVDSGLPDFRGNEGMWRAYPALGKARIAFQAIASPDAFRTHPRLAWGFYGHRLQLYRATQPGPSFGLLADIATRLPQGQFVFTSNVDGQFQKAGFDPERMLECHGTIHQLQCLENCVGDVWPADDFMPEVDASECLLLNQPPQCPYCGGLARPNILMFGDWDWVGDATHAQQDRFEQWRRDVGNPVVIEIGAGTAIPSVRRFGEDQHAPLIRINPADARVPASRDISLPLTGAAAMQGITEALDRSGFYR